MKRIGLLVVIVMLVLSACITNTQVTFDSNVDGAKVTLDQRPLGNTPMTVLLGNAVWEGGTILAEADGYRDVRLPLQKELKVANLVFGLLLWPPSLLWVWGPAPIQYINFVEG